MQTNQEIKMNFKGYEIVIPKGTRLTHKTAIGIDEKYHFVDDFTFIRKMDPKMPLLLHDAIYYGIDIPKQFVEY